MQARLKREEQLKEKHGYKEIMKRVKKSGDLTELEDIKEQIRIELAEFTKEYYAKAEKSGTGRCSRDGSIGIKGEACWKCGEKI